MGCYSMGFVWIITTEKTTVFTEISLFDLARFPQMHGKGTKSRFREI